MFGSGAMALKSGVTRHCDASALLSFLQNPLLAVETKPPEQPRRLYLCFSSQSAEVTRVKDHLIPQLHCHHH